MRIGDPNKEMLEISINKEAYGHSNDSEICTGTESFVREEREAFKKASTLFSYSEYDFLE